MLTQIDVYWQICIDLHILDLVTMYDGPTYIPVFWFDPGLVKAFFRDTHLSLFFRILTIFAQFQFQLAVRHSLITANDCWSQISYWFKTIWFMLFLHDTRGVDICWLLDGKHETDAVCAEGLDQYNIHYFLMLGGTMVAWRHELRAEGREGSGKIW